MQVYLHGNCQASAIGWLLAEARPDLTLKSREVHTFDLASPAARAEYRADIEGADLILTQPISDGYRHVDDLSLSRILASKRPGTRVLVFPSIYFRGYTLQSFALNMPGHIMDYHDVHVADMYRLGLSAEECHERISASDFFSRTFVLDEVLAGLRELIRREQACRADARVSPILAADLDRELLFHTFNHPGRRVLASVTRDLMRAAGEAIELQEDGVSPLNNIRIMPYASAAHHLGLDEMALPELGQMVRLHVAETLLAYVQAAYESYHAVGREAVSAALERHPETAAYLLRYRGSPPGQAVGFSPTSHVLGLFHLLLDRHPTRPEVQYWTQALARIGPTEVLRQFLHSDERQDRLRRTGRRDA